MILRERKHVMITKTQAAKLHRDISTPANERNKQNCCKGIRHNVCVCVRVYAHRPS